MTEFLFGGPEEARATLILAHGAGASMRSPFMNDIVRFLAKRQVRTARFDFPYMTKRRDLGKRRPPDRMPNLLESYIDVVKELRANRGNGKIVIGGKSMGGRVASMVADEVAAAGLVCLGYPFHATGKPDKLRTDHLESLRTPALILQGDRDPMGRRREVEGYQLSGAIEIAFIEDGDHDLKPRVKSGRTHEENMGEAADRIAAFLKGL